MVTAECTRPRHLLRTLSRYRPRAVTLVLLAVVVALLVLSNLSRVRRPEGVGLFSENYGWPMVWCRSILAEPGIGRLQIHRLRLAIDIAVWLLILGATGGICEWLVRRYRPRLRWSLRTMLVATSLLAACFGWFAAASRRAQQQDEFTALFNHEGGGWPGGQGVWIERWGPRWLELFGAERYCQHVGGAWFTYDDGQWSENVLNRLKALSGLRLLYLTVDRLTPAIVETLIAVPQLEVLKLAEHDGDTDGSAARECMTAIGRMKDLDELCLFNLSGEALTELAGLRRLRRLHLQFRRFNDPDGLYENPPLTYLPVFPRLEALTFHGSYLRDADLRRLVAQPRVKSLRIEAQIIDADFAELQKLEALEELTIAALLRTDDILKFRGLKRLKALHIRDIEGDWPWELDVFEHDFDFDDEQAEAASQAYRNTLSSLRSAIPGIVIDDETDTLEWREYSALPPEFESPWRAAVQLPRAAWLYPSFWKRGQFDKYIDDLHLPW